MAGVKKSFVDPTHLTEAREFLLQRILGYSFLFTKNNFLFESN